MVLSARSAASVFGESSPPSTITLGISCCARVTSRIASVPMPSISAGIASIGTTIMEMMVRRSRRESSSSLRYTIPMLRRPAHVSSTSLTKTSSRSCAPVRSRNAASVPSAIIRPP